MQIVAIGDPHFRVDTIFDSQQFLCQVEQHLQTLDHLTHIVVLGDVLHSHEKIHTFALNMAIKFIKMCGSYAPTYVLVGNHDATSNTIFCSDNHWMHVLNDIPNVTVIDKPTIVRDGPYKVVMCPYVSDGRFEESLQTFVKGEWKDANLLFAHQLFDGAKMGTIIATDVEKWNPGYPTVISGHIHDKQQPQTNVIYVGSSQQHAFGESDDKSLALISLRPDGSFSLSEIYLDLKKKVIVYAGVDEIGALKLKDNVSYKIVVQDSDAKLKAFKKTTVYKGLQSRPNVRSVQCKSNDTRPVSMCKDPNGNDFATMLQARIETDDDPYLRSYAVHCLTGTEDVSGKDVLLL